MVDIGAYDQSATLNITIDPSGARKGARQVNKSLDSISNTTKTASTNGMMLKRVLIGIGGAISFAVVTNYADKWKEAGNKLRLYTKSAEELKDMQMKLLDVANRTRASFDPVVTLYARLAANSKMLGKSQADMLKFVELTNVAIALSGSAATEAASAVLQLSQAISSPQVFGQEIKAIILNAPRLAKAIAEGLGFEHGNTAMLKEMVSRGELSNIQLVNALLSQSNKLLEEYGTTKLSISKAFTILSNNMMAYIGFTDEAVSASDKMAAAIKGVGDNFNAVANVIVTGTVGIVSSYLLIFSGAGKLQTAIYALGGAFLFLGKAIKANPVGLAITAAITATSAFFLFRKETKKLTGGLAEFEKAAEQAKSEADRLKNSVEDLRTVDKKGMWDDFLSDIDKVIERMDTIINKVPRLKGALDFIWEGLKRITGTDDESVRKLQQLYNQQNPINPPPLTLPDEAQAVAEQVRKAREQEEYYSKILGMDAEQYDRHIGKLAEKQKQGPLDITKGVRDEFTKRNLQNYQNTIPKEFVLSDEDIKSKGAEANLEYASSQEKLNKTLADLNQYRIAGVLEEDNYRRAINATYAEVPLIIGSINSWNAHIQELSKTWEEDLTDTMVEWTMTGRDSWKEFAQSVIDSLYKMAVQAAIVTPIFNALKAAMNFATGYFGGGGGNENATQDASLNTGITESAVGGPMTAHKPYLVGERGMELFIPQQNGYLVPNNRLNKFSGGSSVGGGGNVMVNVYNNARGTEASANVNDDGNGNFDIDILVSQVEGRLESNINRGQGLAPTLQRRYRLNSARGSVL